MVPSMVDMGVGADVTTVAVGELLSQPEMTMGATTESASAPANANLRVKVKSKLLSASTTFVIFWERAVVGHIVKIVTFRPDNVQSDCEGDGIAERKSASHAGRRAGQSGCGKIGQRDQGVSYGQQGIRGVARGRPHPVRGRIHGNSGTIRQWQIDHTEHDYGHRPPHQRAGFDGGETAAPDD